MAKYRFAIDETGSFTMAENDKSFVCGVLISQNELTIKQKYQQAYKEFELGAAPNDTKSIIETEAFHFNSLSDDKKRICRELLLPLADKIYVSKGKPALFANNQNWWLVAVTVVIQEFLKTEAFEQEDKVEILIDNRNEKTFGLIIEEDRKGKTDEEKYKEFIEYHDIIKEQIQKNVNPLAQSRGITVNIKFFSDTSSFFVNLADVVCGIVRKDYQNVQQNIVTCPCSHFLSSNDPEKFIDDNPATALSIIFQEIANDKLIHLKSINTTLLKKIRNNADSYEFMWNMFYDLIKSKINERTSNSNLVAIKPLVEQFLIEIKKLESIIPSDRKLELLSLFAEYYSHIGETELPFNKEMFINSLKDTGIDSESRLLRKWEKYVSFSLREAQISFNGYKFDNAVKLFENLWNQQEKIIKDIPAFSDSDDTKKDEPTTAIVGTLAQAYAYSNNLDDAIMSFDMSKDYSVKTSNRTNSYLFTIYHRQADIVKARIAFAGQTETTPEDYFRKKVFDNVWNLLSYCKLRALELHKNGSTQLHSIDLKSLPNYHSEYPFPLILKWEGIALWLENPVANMTIVEQYFTDAINNLTGKDNGFAIRSLALPVIQCFALVNNQNPFHSEYNRILADMKKTCDGFSHYVDKNADMLNHIKNDASIWDRAMSLPFIYA